MNTITLCYHGEIRKKYLFGHPLVRSDVRSERNELETVTNQIMVPSAFVTDMENLGKRFFLFCCEDIYCGYSLEAPHRGTSNDYPQHKLLSRNKRYICISLLFLVNKKQLIYNYKLHNTTFRLCICTVQSGSSMWITLNHALQNTWLKLSPCHAEPGYTLPWQTV